MANIKVDVNFPIKDGMDFTFHAPCDCSAIDGLTVVHPGGTDRFVFKDAHGNTLAGTNNLFASGALIKVILDVTNNSASIQNADTNGYLEKRIDAAGRIYVGSGDPPDEYAIQIDPNGAVLLVDSSLDAMSINPIANQVVAREIVRLNGEIMVVRQQQNEVADFVTEAYKAGQTGYTLNYRKWASGIVEGWLSDEVTIDFKKDGTTDSWSYNFYIGLQDAEIPFYANTGALYLTASVNDGNSITCTPKIVNHPQNGGRCIYLRFATTNPSDIFYDETNQIEGFSTTVNIQMKNTGV